MEAEFVEWLRTRLPPHPSLQLGLGDDAALLACQQGAIVTTTDLLCDGVHFRFGDVSPERIGHKAMGVNLSDVAAMAARPRAAFVSLLWPADAASGLAMQLYEGMIALADQYDVAIAGGDTNRWDGKLVLSVTLLGESTEHGALRRDGAQPGDAIVVTGKLGGSLLGHHLDFQPRVDEAMFLHENYRLHAGMDISDGLSLDLSRLCAESRVGAEIDRSLIPVSEAAVTVSGTTSKSATEHALSDGEDFELLLCLPASEAERLVHDQPLDIPVTRIGTTLAEAGIWQLTASGQRQPLSPAGFLH